MMFEVNQKYEEIGVEFKFRKRTLKKANPFLLLGNAWDGYFEQGRDVFYPSFNDLKNNLKKDMEHIFGVGEWDFCLYQVPSNYKIVRGKSGYLRPNRGKLIHKYSYMDSVLRHIEVNDKQLRIYNLWQFQDIFENDQYEEEIENEMHLTVFVYSWIFKN